jgi:hypothetical protein
MRRMEVAPLSDVVGSVAAIFHDMALFEDPSCRVDFRLSSSITLYTWKDSHAMGV